MTAPAFHQLVDNQRTIIAALQKARAHGYCIAAGLIESSGTPDQLTNPDLSRLDWPDLVAIAADIEVLCALEAAIGRDLPEHAPWLANWIDFAPALIATVSAGAAFRDGARQ
jgi:hypothetical protein